MGTYFWKNYPWTWVWVFRRHIPDQSKSENPTYCFSIRFFDHVVYVHQHRPTVDLLNVEARTVMIVGKVGVKPFGDVPPTWVAKSASIWLTPYRRIWYMNGSIFQKLRKVGNFAENLVQLWADWYEWVTFFFKIGIFMGVLSNFAAARPYIKTKLWVRYMGKMWQFLN